MFLNELSRVFFKKSNLRSKSWWLSAFYSFCIHSIVRRGLVILVQTRYELEFHEETLCSPCSVVENYLVVALRFFVATSGIYDPLMKSTNPPESITSETKSSIESDSEKHFKMAREAVKQETWKATSISGSMQYLQNLFEDNGQCLTSWQTNSASSEKDDDYIAEFRAKVLGEEEHWKWFHERFGNQRAQVERPAFTCPNLRPGDEIQP
jgi:hypothetical protein